MGSMTILAPRAVLVAALVGLLSVQTVLVPRVWHDLDGADHEVRDVRGTVFADAACRWVDLMIGAIACASALLLALGVLLAPGEAVPPGMVLLIGGAAAVVAGIALVVVFMRSLLRRAVAREVEATHLRAELDEVLECQPGDVLRFESGDVGSDAGAAPVTALDRAAAVPPRAIFRPEQRITMPPNIWRPRVNRRRDGDSFLTGCLTGN